MVATIYNPATHREKLLALGTFAAAIVDNIGPELDAIEAAGARLTESKLEAAAHENALTVLHNTRIAARVIKYLSSIAGRRPIQLVPLDVRELLVELRPLLSRLLGEFVTLEISCATDLWLIKADLQMLESVILALSVNARDAMPNGGKLRWYATNITANECKIFNDQSISTADYVVIEAVDAGRGIPPEIVDRIFEPFFSTEARRGTGTGLMLVYGSIKQMDGHILVESEICRGTTFRVFLPPTSGR